MAHNRVNMINFIRAVEPRLPIDLLGTLQEEIALVRRHRLPATWLIQYDALVDPQYVRLLKEALDETQEIGIWFEVVQPLVEDAGLPWRGRYPWDWHANVGFSIGYTPEQRRRLADVFMERFHRTFGYYPRSAGSWFWDAPLLEYLSSRYGIVAACNCKDQWGTDGYTLWGGYYHHGYYPSRQNAFMPAQHAGAQIPVPVFRMLGSDPIYQYDAADNGNGQEVITLEPVYTGAKGGGGVPEWVRWYFDTNFNAPQFSFGYTQVGQENSFGWEKIRGGLTDQITLLAQKQAEGLLTVETLGDTGAWFRRTYPVTPAAAVYALKDWRNLGNQSIWFYNRFYRANLFLEGSFFRIRDLHLFRETYPERYLTAVCDSASCVYDTLPLMDGGQWSAPGLQPGIMPMLQQEDGLWAPAPVSSILPRKLDENSLEVTLQLSCRRTLTLCLTERAICFRMEGIRWGLRLLWGEAATQITACDSRLTYCHNGYAYAMTLQGARLTPIVQHGAAHILDAAAEQDSLTLSL